MEDNDLLMMAAKAAGIEAGVIHQRPHRRCPEGWTPWNPLRDDGDAFRLAVRLGIRLRCINMDHAEVDMGKDTDPMFWQAVTTNSDAYAATRRAILTIAAMQGMSMQSPRVGD